MSDLPIPNNIRFAIDRINADRNAVGAIPINPVRIYQGRQPGRRFFHGPVFSSAETRKPTDRTYTTVFAPLTGDARRDTHAVNFEQTANRRLGLARSMGAEIDPGYAAQRLAKGHMPNMVPPNPSYSIVNGEVRSDMPHRNPNTGSWEGYALFNNPLTGVFVTDDPALRSHYNPRGGAWVSSAGGYRSGVEETVLHPYNSILDFNPSIIPQAYGGDYGNAYSRRTTSRGTGFPYQTYNATVTPLNNASNLAYRPAEYLYNPAEFAKAIGGAQTISRNAQGQRFHNFSDWVAWMHRNNMIKGNKLNAQAFGSNSAGSEHSLETNGLLKQYRNLSDNLMLTEANYRRNPGDSLAREQYERAYRTYHGFMDYGDYIWPQTMETDRPVKVTQATAPKVMERYGYMQRQSADVNHRLGEEFRSKRPWMQKGFKEYWKNAPAPDNSWLSKTMDNLNYQYWRYGKWLNNTSPVKWARGKLGLTD